MSKTLNSSFSSNTPIISGTEKSSTGISWNTITTPAQFVVSTPSSITASKSTNWVDSEPPKSSIPSPAPSTKESFKNAALTAEDEERSKQTAARFAASLALDHISALYPNVDTAFEDAVDVVNRLLPYHVFQIPGKGLETITKGDKGKRKAAHQDLVDEIAETKFALECVKRKRKLEERFRRIRLKSGTRLSPDNQAYVLARAVLDADRIATGALTKEYHDARVEKDIRDRERRVVSMNPRPSPYPTLSQPHFYRGHPYTYTQPYNAAPQQTTPASASGHSTSTSVASAPNSRPPPSSIPFQIPVGSMPALQVLGIIPVPVASLPPADQPQPLAVLRGSTANGTMLNLEVNVPLLQTGQMNGLAMILNSLMSRGGEAGVGTSSATPHGVGNPATQSWVAGSGIGSNSGVSSGPR